MNEHKYRAIPHNDFYFLVESNYIYHKDEIILSKDDYFKLLRGNQEYGYVIRSYQDNSGKTLLKLDTHGQPSLVEIWDTKTGSWIIDKELLKTKNLEYIQEQIVWANMEISILDDIKSVDGENDEILERINQLREFRIYYYQLKSYEDLSAIADKFIDRPYID